MNEDQSDETSENDTMGGTAHDASTDTSARALCEIAGNHSALDSGDLLAALAFSAWYVNAWERDPYKHDESDIARMWVRFRDEWLPSLKQEHCGDCTRCHTEAYMKHAAIVARVTANVKDEPRGGL